MESLKDTNGIDPHPKLFPEEQNPINPAGVEGAGEAPPRRRLPLEIPMLINDLMKGLADIAPTIRFKAVRSKDLPDNNVVSWVHDGRLYFLSWHDYAPMHMDEIEDDMNQKEP